MLENFDKIMHLRFNFDACPMHSPSGFVHLTHQNLSARALFCLNSLAKVNTQLLLLIYKYTYIYLYTYKRGIFLDFSSAFDKVDHNLLLTKLHSMGIRGFFLQWIQDFLSQRKQQVVFDQGCSLRLVFCYFWCSSGLCSWSHFLFAFCQ